MINYYAVLGVHRGSDSTDIRAAFRAKALETHPDKVPGKEEEFKLYAKAKSMLVSFRTSYDRDLATLGTQCARCSGTGTRSKAKSWAVGVLVPCVTCGGCGFINLPEGE